MVGRGSRRSQACGERHQMRGCGCQTRAGSPEQGLGVDEVQNAPGNVEVSLPQSLTEDLVWQSAQQAAQQ